MSCQSSFTVTKPKNKIRIAIAFNGLGEWCAYGSHADEASAMVSCATDTLDETSQFSDVATERCWVEVSLPSAMVLPGAIVND